MESSRRGISELVILALAAASLAATLGCARDNAPSEPSSVPSSKLPTKLPWEPGDLRMDFKGKGVVKAESRGQRYFIVLEELAEAKTCPGKRAVELLDDAGTVLLSWFPAADRKLIDADFDGEYVYTASIVSPAGGATERIALEKIDLAGVRVADVVLLEEPDNPTVLDDRLRIAAKGESLYLAAFENDETTWLYRLDRDALSVKWSLMVEPDARRVAMGMIGGSYDEFGQMSHRFSVYLDVDGQDNAFVGIPVMGNALFRTIDFHNKYFGESLEIKSLYTGSPSAATDALVTKVSASGGRVYSTVMGTQHQDEIHGLLVADGKVFAYGRCAVTSMNDWDPFVVAHDAASGAELYSSPYDLGSNEIFLSASYDSTKGQLLLGGVGGWSQNPDGVSVTEDGTKLLVVVDSRSGEVAEAIVQGNGPRQNQIRSVMRLSGGKLLVAGWENGPGTHSGDSDPGLVTADGFLDVR